MLVKNCLLSGTIELMKVGWKNSISSFGHLSMLTVYWNFKCLAIFLCASKGITILNEIFKKKICSISLLNLHVMNSDLYMSKSRSLTVIINAGVDVGGHADETGCIEYNHLKMLGKDRYIWKRLIGFLYLFWKDKSNNEHLKIVRILQTQQTLSFPRGLQKAAANKWKKKFATGISLLSQWILFSVSNFFLK